MARLHELSRRLFLFEVGKGALAVVVLGAGVACAGDDNDNGTAAEPNGAGGETRTETTGGPAGDNGGLVWQRAALGSVSAYVLARGQEAAIVDTGLTGSEAQIGEAVRATGLAWGDVRHVIVTHKHPDHAGSLGAVLGEATNATVWAGQADIGAIRSPRPVAAADGADVFGLEIVATPGHTPGHIAVFDAGARLLVAGDAVRSGANGVEAPSPQFTEDMAMANESVKKLAGLEVDTILFGHGDPIEGGGRRALESFAATLG